MLKSLRAGAKSPLMKVLLFGMLLFAMAGLALMDVQGMFHSGAVDDTIAKFGREKLSAQTFDRTVQDVLRQNKIPQAEAYKAGLPRKILDQEIDNRLFVFAAADAGLAASDALAAAKARAIISPYVKDGVTEKDAFARFLAAYGMSEGQFAATVKQQIAVEQLLSTLGSGVRAPKALAVAALRFKGEERRADTLRLSAAAVKAPSAEELKGYYDGIAKDYASPERRTISVVAIDKSAVTGSGVSQEEIRKAYDDNADAYKTPETRLISQALFADEALAKQVQAAALKSGGLAAAAQGKGTFVKAQSFTAKSIAGELSAAAFAGKQGDIPAPVKSPLGWHVLHVEKVTPGAAKSFESVKGDIEKELAAANGADALYALATKIDDEVAGGASVDDIAKKHNLKETAYENIGADAKTPDAQLVKAAFGLAEGAASALIEMPGDSYAIVGVKKVTPSATPPLEKIRAEVEKRWTAEQKLKILSAQAQEIVARVQKGEALSKIAAEKGLQTGTTGFLGRDAKSPLAPALFAIARVGGAGLLPGDGDVTVLALAERKVPDAAALSQKDIEAAQTQLDNAQRDNLLAELRQHLMDEYHVTVNDKLLGERYAPQQAASE